MYSSKSGVHSWEPNLTTQKGCVEDNIGFGEGNADLYNTKSDLYHSQSDLHLSTKMCTTQCEICTTQTRSVQLKVPCVHLKIDLFKMDLYNSHAIHCSAKPTTHSILCNSKRNLYRLKKHCYTLVFVQFRIKFVHLCFATPLAKTSRRNNLARSIKQKLNMN